MVNTKKGAYRRRKKVLMMMMKATSLGSTSGKEQPKMALRGLRLLKAGRNSLEHIKLGCQEW